MNKLLSIGLCAASAALAPLAQAASYGNYGMDYARVIRVEPIYREIEITTPQRQCYDQPVHRGYRANDGGDGALAAVVGGVVGGVIGHSLGRGRHRAPVTIAGTLAGVGIGRHIARQRDDYYAERIGYQRVCQVVDDTRYERRVEGYDVTYRYRGETYETRLLYDPGPRLRVQVDVTPVLEN
ncbi:glycine zipper 2TM domain-containing protein [Nitrococcus mobilis]|uniref:Glycine zipper 2TM domain-containing protein n=1 Tax=Nitrococcus mobilis Nb-231 TaxID=314278 RepID=A4BSS2_9GAMM|nr:glycine zipper 2TM domain-containing protein [Nitrococcus mobilis]EAR21166.1 hypothetical protein NB231_00555 [Nitrococcus mobilis Nb-231]